MIGHDAVRAELEAELPAVTLLLGPPSVGKTTLAAHLAAHHGLFMVAVPVLSAANARELVIMAPRRGIRGTCFVVCLDGSTETAQNILLKVLEETPPHAKFILTASRLPLPTICSRAVVHRLGLLTDDQVAHILQDVCGASGEEAAKLACLARGQVANAVSVLSRREDSRVRSVVAAAVKSARDGGGITLELAVRNWSAEHTGVLRAWAEEAASGRWTWFAESFAPGVTSGQARRVLFTLNKYSGSRNAAAVALADAFREGK